MFFAQFQSVEVLKEETDFTYRRWKRTWWENQRAIMKILAHHDSTYVIEGAEVTSHEFVQRKIDLERQQTLAEANGSDEKMGSQ